MLNFLSGEFVWFFCVLFSLNCIFHSKFPSTLNKSGEQFKYERRGSYVGWTIVVYESCVNKTIEQIVYDILSLSSVPQFTHFEWLNALCYRSFTVQFRMWERTYKQKHLWHIITVWILLNISNSKLYCCVHCVQWLENSSSDNTMSINA